MPGSGFRRAVADVQRELRQLGLGSLVERIAIDRSWSLFDHGTRAVGLFYPGDRRCRQIGRIAIPAIALPLHNGFVSTLRCCGFSDRPRTSLRFVLRHEMAHGLAHWLGMLDRPGPPWGRGSCFTPYATTSAGEDLAETVALVITHRGRLPRRRPCRDLRAKWRAAKRLIHQARTHHQPSSRRAACLPSPFPASPPIV